MKPARAAFIIFTALLLAQAAFGSEASASLYNEANRYYTQGQFKSAIPFYEDAAKAGVKNSDLYYNLGNAWYKVGDGGRAMLYWLRAERLNPRDPDLRANLGLLQKQVNKSLAAQPPNPFSDFLAGWRDLAPARTWAVIFSAAIWGFWVLLSARLIMGRRKFSSLLSILLALFIILMMGSGAGFASRRSWETEPAAVVLARDLAARSGPGETFTPVFNLAPGARILVKDCREGYCQIELPPGMVGWVAEKDLERI